MTDKVYNITLTGNIAESVDRESAINAFAKMFKMDPSQAEATLAKAPLVIKSNVDETTAKKFASALKKAGVEYKAVASDIAKTQPMAAIQETEAAPATARRQRQEAPAALVGESNDATVHEIVDENPKGYAYKIEGKPDYSFLTVSLPADSTLKVEASAMATMDTHIRMKTKARGGLGRFLTGENIFINEFTAEGAPAEIGIAPGTPGDLIHRYLDNEIIYLQNSAYVASAMDVEVETKWQGLVKGFFSGESLFLIRCSGSGDLWFNTYGAAIEIDVDGEYVVDTGNIVAFTDGLEYKITKVGGYKSLFFSGEGFVCRFSGSGKVWIQTRGTQAFASWAHWYRPVKNSN